MAAVVLLVVIVVLVLVLVLVLMKQQSHKKMAITGECMTTGSSEVGGTRSLRNPLLSNVCIHRTVAVIP